MRSTPTHACSPARWVLRWTAPRLYRRYKKAQHGAELRPLRFHDLRHTFGTQAIAGGANVHDLQRWMGHRHLATTMRYVHYRPQDEGADLLGHRFAGSAAELDALLGDPAARLHRGLAVHDSRRPRCDGKRRHRRDVRSRAPLWAAVPAAALGVRRGARPPGWSASHAAERPRLGDRLGLVALVHDRSSAPSARSASTPGGTARCRPCFRTEPSQRFRILKLVDDD